MKFLYEKQTRKFCMFLILFCVVQICFFGFCGVLKGQDIRRILITRELTASSYLLEQGVPSAVVAAAWNHTGMTEEGMRLLEMTGHTEDSGSFLILLIEQTSIPAMIILLSAGVIFSTVLLFGTFFFLRERERMYEHAEMVISQYAEDQFCVHLPEGKDGTIYQLFESIEELSMSLRAKGETEHKAKSFLKDMISNISHQLKTPLAALHMYTEIITEEPGCEETVKSFALKSAQSLERMDSLIQSLLKMARLDTGSIVFEKRKCPLSELAEQSVYDLMGNIRYHIF